MSTKAHIRVGVSNMFGRGSGARRTFAFIYRCAGSRDAAKWYTAATEEMAYEHWADHKSGKPAAPFHEARITRSCD